MSDGIKLQITTYCEGVRTGSKPVAMTSIQTRYLDEMKVIVENEDLRIYVEDVIQDDNWKTAFIYKHEYLLDVIKVAPKYPNSTFDHWVLGKLFGYSDEAIGDFLVKMNK